MVGNVFIKIGSEPLLFVARAPKYTCRQSYEFTRGSHEGISSCAHTCIVFLYFWWDANWWVGGLDFQGNFLVLAGSFLGVCTLNS